PARTLLGMVDADPKAALALIERAAPSASREARVRSATSGPQGRTAARAYARKPSGADASRPAFEGVDKESGRGPPARRRRPGPHACDPHAQAFARSFKVRSFLRQGAT